MWDDDDVSRIESQYTSSRRFSKNEASYIIPSDIRNAISKIEQRLQVMEDKASDQIKIDIKVIRDFLDDLEKANVNTARISAHKEEQLISYKQREAGAKRRSTISIQSTTEKHLLQVHELKIRNTELEAKLAEHVKVLSILKRPGGGFSSGVDITRSDSRSATPSYDKEGTIKVTAAFEGRLDKLRKLRHKNNPNRQLKVLLCLLDLYDDLRRLQRESKQATNDWLSDMKVCMSSITGSLQSTISLPEVDIIRVQRLFTSIAKKLSTDESFIAKSTLQRAVGETAWGMAVLSPLAVDRYGNVACESLVAILNTLPRGIAVALIDSLEERSLIITSDSYNYETDTHSRANSAIDPGFQFGKRNSETSVTSLTMTTTRRRSTILRERSSLSGPPLRMKSMTPIDHLIKSISTSTSLTDETKNKLVNVLRELPNEGSLVLADDTAIEPFAPKKNSKHSFRRKSTKLDLRESCANCGKTPDVIGHTMRLCPCHTVAYCGESCQINNWAKHRPVCSKGKSKKSDGSDRTSQPPEIADVQWKNGLTCWNDFMLKDYCKAFVVGPIFQKDGKACRTIGVSWGRETAIDAIKAATEDSNIEPDLLTFIWPPKGLSFTQRMKKKASFTVKRPSVANPDSVSFPDL